MSVQRVQSEQGRSVWARMPSKRGSLCGYTNLPSTLTVVVRGRTFFVVVLLCILPTERSLRWWLANVQTTPCVVPGVIQSIATSTCVWNERDRVCTLVLDEIALRTTPTTQLAMCMGSQMMHLNGRQLLLTEPWLFSSLLIGSASGFYHRSHIGARHCSKSFAGYTHRTSLRHQHMCERPRLKWAPVRRVGWTAAFPWCYGQEDILFYL